LSYGGLFGVKLNFSVTGSAIRDLASLYNRNPNVGRGYPVKKCSEPSVPEYRGYWLRQASWFFSEEKASSTWTNPFISGF